MKIKRVSAWLAVAALSAVSLVSLPAEARQESPATAVAWSKDVWLFAAGGSSEAELLAKLSTPPAGGAGEAPVVKLASAVDQFAANVKVREADRAAQSKRVGAELDKNLKEERSTLSLSHALRSAVELQMLAQDKKALLADPRVSGLILDTAAAARAAEAGGDWFTASELYARLDTLLEEQGTYKNDLQRSGQRLAMIRLYAPERFWQLRKQRYDAEQQWAKDHADDKPDGEGDANPAGAADKKPDAADKPKPKKQEEFPPYNAQGDDWREKLAGINVTMVTRAVSQSAERHVEHTPMLDILRGGLDAIRTLVGTSDLEGTFAGLADQAARQRMLNALAMEEARLREVGGRLGPADLRDVVSKVLEVNDQTVKVPQPAILHEFGSGAMLALDEFSGIIWPDEMRRFKRSTEGSFIGVGIQIQMDELQNIKVVTPLEGTPAWRAGVKAGDIIKKVDTKPTWGFSLDQAVEVITGKPGTPVTLTLEREIAEGAKKGEKEDIDFPLVREEIRIITVKGWKRSGQREDDWDWFIDADNRIGYVRLTQFSDGTDQEFDRAIKQMKASGLNGLILDLRFNPGGLLDQAVAIANRFIDPAAIDAAVESGNSKLAASFEGLIVSTETKGPQKNEVVQRERARRGVASLARVPVIVLVNEGSASASEIVSGAIQDYAHAGVIRAILIGQRSFGKGSVQNVWRLPASGGAEAAIKLTTQYYRLPGGRLIHRKPGQPEWGVKPDVMVEMLPKQIGDSLRLRQDADVAVAGAVGGPNPDDLLTKSLDLQLQHALLLLRSQALPKMLAQADAKAGGAPAQPVQR